MSGMSIIGGKFKREEVFVPDVMMAARAMNVGLSILDQSWWKREMSRLDEL